MSWSFRVLVLTVTLVCGLAPQIACFMPDQPLTQPERDCCQKMASDCGGHMDMSCCQTIVHIEVGVTAKAPRSLVPDVTIAPQPVSLPTGIPAAVLTNLSVRNDHAPPPFDTGASPLIL